MNNSHREFAWCRLISKYDRRMRAYALRTRCSIDEADQIVADVWQLAVDHEDTILTDADPWILLHRLLKSVCASRVRVWRREVLLREALLDAATLIAAEPLDVADEESGLVAWVIAQLDRLPNRQRFVLDRHFRHQWPYSAIARDLGTTEATTRVHAFRGLARLRDFARANEKNVRKEIGDGVGICVRGP